MKRACSSRKCEAEATIGALVIKPCCPDWVNKYVYWCDHHTEKRGKFKCARCSRYSRIGQIVPVRDALRQAFILSSEHEHAKDLFELMMDQVTLTYPDLDKIAAEPWPKSKVLDKPPGYVKVRPTMAARLAILFLHVGILIGILIGYFVR